MEEVVASVLSFLAADADQFDRFLALTGTTVTDLRAAAHTSGFAESLLDYLCSDEPLLVAYAEASGQAPDAIEAIRQSLAPPPWDP